MIFYTLRTASNSQLVQENGFEMMLLEHANPIVALISSIIVFLVVAYAESSKLELPLTHGKVRGHRGQYPIRLVYASNIPVILMAALLANVNMFTLLFHSHPTLSTVPILGSNGAWSQSEWFGSYYEGSTTPHDGFAWYSSMIGGVSDWLIPLLNQQGDIHGHSLWQIMMHVFVYVFFMTAGSTVFAKVLDRDDQHGGEGRTESRSRGRACRYPDSGRTGSPGADTGEVISPRDACSPVPSSGS
jgi:Preprotein translocase subunit SecY